MLPKRIKTCIKHRFPVLVPALRALARQRLRWGSVESTFTRIYRTNAWDNEETVSGPGSTLAATKAIREELPILTRRLDVRTFLDIPCGDLNWMTEVQMDLDLYIGADIVAELIEAHRRRYSEVGRTFLKLDITRDPLPRVDLILCRDLLGHLSFADIRSALNNVEASDSKYLLTTTFPSVRKNRDILSGDWRPLNLERAPFWFPEPREVVDERWSGVSDKCLGLWVIHDLVV